nr:MAG TPA: hypothetical protein [Caudoviricetes sp.]
MKTFYIHSHSQYIDKHKYKHMYIHSYNKPRYKQL